MVTLSLDSLTLTIAPAADYLAAAGAAGFDLVSLWTNPAAAHAAQVIDRENFAACAAIMAAAGLRGHLIEAFDLTSVAKVRAYRPAIELGARLGGRALLAYHGSNGDRSAVVDALAALVELATEHGLEVVVEPVAIGRTRTIAAAEALIRDAQVEAGLLVDTLHFVRSGDTITTLAGLAGDRIRYVQINDGPDHMNPADMLAEAAGERLLPGCGAFPLIDILNSIPRDIPWAVEAPALGLARAGWTAIAQAEAAMAAMRGVISMLNPEHDGHPA